MDTSLVTKKFEEVGARVKFGEIRPTRESEGEKIRIDIRTDRLGEYYLIDIGDGVFVDIPDIQKVDRHLLLFARDPELRRFLCGHDERNWFIAAIPEDSKVSNVKEAKESLKPQDVKFSEKKAGIKKKDLGKKRTKAFVRQGEWFFIPAPELQIQKSLILRNEPIQRGRGTPHMVEEVFRRGGENLYISREYPNGLSENRYQNLIKLNPELKKTHWEVRRVNPTAFGRGRVTHKDHKTIVLQFWHEIIMNTEFRARAMRNVAFID